MVPFLILIFSELASLYLVNSLSTESVCLESAAYNSFMPPFLLHPPNQASLNSQATSLWKTPVLLKAAKHQLQIFLVLCYRPIKQHNRFHTNL